MGVSKLSAKVFEKWTTPLIQINSDFEIKLKQCYQIRYWLLLWNVSLEPCNVMYCTCSAASRLMARANCNCSSSSPLVWGLACSNSEDAFGDVAETNKIHIQSHYHSRNALLPHPAGSMRKLSGQNKEAKLPSACWASHNSLHIISLLLKQWTRVLPPILIGLGQAMCLWNKHLRSTWSSHRPLKSQTP